MNLAAAIHWKFGPCCDTVGNVITKWYHPTMPQPTDDECKQICADFAAMDACYSSRKAAYGSVEEQLDFMVKNGAQALIDRNLAIKAQFPKPVVL